MKATPAYRLNVTRKELLRIGRECRRAMKREYRRRKKLGLPTLRVEALQKINAAPPESED